MAGISRRELISDQEWSQLQDHLELSPRQADILIQLLHGKSDKQIAGELNISLPTVRTHLTRLFHKYDLNDRVELVLHVFGILRECSPRWQQVLQRNNT